ncbi:MAG: DUF4340 domain-containing protein [Lachnospiraceae bacterium]|nr:DUF4340 domain-containing protein [Lachnospiraceae bacterium]
MKKSQIITIILLAVLLVGLGVGYIIMKDYKTEKEMKEAAEEETTTISLGAVNSEEITAISYKYNDVLVELVKEGDSWEHKESGAPIDEEKSLMMTDALSSIDAIKVITDNTDNLEEYGLDKPTVSYTVTTSAGKTYSLSFGLKLTTTESAYYALYNDDNKVYSMSANYYEPFAVTLADITAILDEINVDADKITGVDVSTKEGYELSVEQIENVAEDEYYTWEIKKPYSNVMADTDRWKVKLNAYGSMQYKKCVAYNAEQYTEYGLDDPYATVKIDYYTVEGEDADVEVTPAPDAKREYAQFILEIGDEVTIDDSTYYYVRPDGSSNIYVMDAVEVLNLYNYKAYEVADSCIYSELVDEIYGFDVEYGDVKLVIERKDEKPVSTPKPGTPKKKKDTINVYYVNGKKVEEEDALNLYSFAYLLECSGEVNAEDEILNAKPALQITYYPKEGEDVVVKYLPYKNENFYQIDKNGMKYFLTDKRGIDTLIKNYEEFINNKL